MNTGEGLTRRRLLGAAGTAALLPAVIRPARAATPVRIGVLNDQSGLYADLGGPGSVVAAHMAVADAGGSVAGRPVEILVGDHQNKADIGAAIARKWFDVDAAGMAIGFDNSSVALAVERVAAEHDRVAIGTAVGSVDFTGRDCTPTAASWLYDSYALTTSLAQALVAAGRDTWFFVTVDYAFGHSMEHDARAAVIAHGGRVLGSVRHPLGTADFSSYLVQAQASGAKVVAFANGGGDLINAMKQAAEFGLPQSGVTMAAMLLFVSDVHSLGLHAAQGLTFVTAFYWDRDPAARAWSERFMKRFGRMPTMAQAGVYSATRHYLRALAAGPDDGGRAVMARMRAAAVDDFYVHDGTIRADGRLMHPMYLMQVKTPQESKGPWDYYRLRATIPADRAFRPLSASDCPLVRG
ncbi:ABC transporter substrate-binding protein [Acidisphaera rubrifaciens]|uniref:ABC transporter branched-chain amino acid permease n=1 Tax=Acidisphaera rubrifaciens HS-AP3 TaxID=1231350 RepID=A0A0D6P5S5_9PROT|nr:ABC transporter substrate-binding protein [Acidisphaera rubrifaciens]GAN77027.1 ABC transporter branched-chain amino acid permease [Acidisphaera rubrifaciens HS-AP3]